MDGGLNILVVGNGGREHALERVCRRSPLTKRVICAPGNGGMDSDFTRNIGVMDFAGIAKLCLDDEIHLVVVGPEAPLVGDGTVGLKDYLWLHAPNVKVFGHSAAAARLEGSKAYGNEFCRKANVRKGGFEVVASIEHAESYLDLCDFPVAVKWDGLHAGKGVIIAKSREEALDATKRGLVHGVVVLEEFIKGKEVSFICFVSGTTVVPLWLSRDYKRVGNGDEGANTGGMGAYCPLPEYKAGGTVYHQLVEMAQAVAAEAVARKHPLEGILYIGAMVDDEDIVWQIEFNVRGGSPETEALLLGLESDFVEYAIATVSRTLKAMPPLKFHPGAVVCVVIASGNYPEASTSKPLVNPDFLRVMEEYDIVVFHAGTTRTPEGLVATGGRVFMLCAYADTHAEARGRINTALERVGDVFEHAKWRTDIAANAAHIKAD